MPPAQFAPGPANEICATCALGLLIESLHEVASLIWALVLFDDFTHIGQRSCELTSDTVRGQFENLQLTYYFLP